MRSRTGGRWILAGGLVAIVMALPVDGAVAGEFAVANCRADPLNFSTRAFDHFVTRGMKIRRACDPEGPGLRGLITANVVRGGEVQRGSVAMATITAPPGTRFTTFRWAGTARRRDCGYALQILADAPDIKTVRIKNVRANEHCPRPRRAQAAGYLSRTFNVSGATRIVQRVACVGGKGRSSCSARGSNYLRTYEAEVRIADVVPPSVGIIADTPLARGEWVRGIQPLNYDASDNVGVRKADALAAGRSGGFHERAMCVRGSREDVRGPGSVPERPGPDQRRTRSASRKERSRSSCRPRTRRATSATPPPVTARIDNTPPGRVDVSVEGGDGWRNRNDFAVAWANPPEVDRAPIAAVGYKLCSVQRGAAAVGSRRAATSRASVCRCRHRASGHCRCGAVTPLETKARRPPPCRSRFATTPSRRSSVLSRRRPPTRRAWPCP